MKNRIAEKLLRHVYHAVSVVVSLDENGWIEDVFLFDTEFAGECMRASANARELWLISHHPEGGCEPSSADLKNLSQLRGGAKGIPVRLFLSSEYYTCFEIALSKAEHL